MQHFILHHILLKTLLLNNNRGEKEFVCHLKHGLEKILHPCRNLLIRYHVFDLRTSLSSYFYPLLDGCFTIIQSSKKFISEFISKLAKIRIGRVKV